MLYRSNLTNIPSSQPGRPGSDLKFSDFSQCHARTWQHVKSQSPALAHPIFFLMSGGWTSQLTYQVPFIPPANIWLLPTLRPKGTHTDGMICPPEDGSREEIAQALELVSGLFGQEILGYSYPENGLGGMHGLLPWSYWLFIQRREAQPEEGLQRVSGCWAMAGAPLPRPKGSTLLV